MNFADLLDERDVVVGIQQPDIAAAAAALLRETLPRRGYAPQDVVRIVDAVIAREREAPTLCETIAIPHARDPQASSFVAAIAVNREGVTAGPAAPRVLIAFISPEGRRSEHLALLSSLARLARDRASVEAIATAPDTAAVLAAVRAHPG